MTVGTQALAVNPGLGNGIGDLGVAEAEHLGDDGGTGDLDQDHMVQANLVVGVKEGQAALNLVSLDHALKDIADGEDLAVGEVAASLVSPVDPVSDSQNSAEVVGGMSPFGSQPAVVIVEPADHGANVEGAIDGIEDEVSAGNLGAVGNDGARNDRSQKLRALLEA